MMLEIYSCRVVVEHIFFLSKTWPNFHWKLDQTLEEQKSLYWKYFFLHLTHLAQFVYVILVTFSYFWLCDALLLISLLINNKLSRSVHGKRCSDKMQQIYKRTPITKCTFNKVARQLYWNLTSPWVFSINLLHIFRIFFPKNTYGGPLLHHVYKYTVIHSSQTTCLNTFCYKQNC